MASGVDALYSNDIGSYNTASGGFSLFHNTTGHYNTADGDSALVENTTGDNNTASGANALFSNTAGVGNTASGFDALASNTSGNGNTAIGLTAGASNTTGNGNTFVGDNADGNAGIYTNGTALGFQARLTASNSIVLGNSSISRIYANVTTITAISDRRRRRRLERSTPISASISSKSSSRYLTVSTMATRPSAMALSHRTSNRPCRFRCTAALKDPNPSTALR